MSSGSSSSELRPRRRTPTTALSRSRSPPAVSSLSTSRSARPRRHASIKARSVISAAVATLNETNDQGEMRKNARSRDNDMNKAADLKEDKGKGASQPRKDKKKKAKAKTESDDELDLPDATDETDEEWLQRKLAGTKYLRKQYDTFHAQDGNKQDD